jgi:hypothetical protein
VQASTPKQFGVITQHLRTYLQNLSSENKPVTDPKILVPTQLVMDKTMSISHSSSVMPSIIDDAPSSPRDLSGQFKVMTLKIVDVPPK